MHRELIRSNPSWRDHPQFDTVLINTNADEAGMKGMVVGRVMGFMCFTYQGERYPCTLIDWFEMVQDEPSDVTGMYIVQPELDDENNQVSSIVHLDSIFCAVHLTPLYHNTVIPVDFCYWYTLDAFETFYINCYSDYHAHECIM